MADSPVINIQKLTYRSHSHGEKYFARVAPVAPLIGGKDLGYRVVRVMPGKQAWPRHAHLNNEEMFFILEGSGTLLLGEQSHPLQAGDFVACPAGAELAHQIVNTGSKELVYLAVSTMKEPDVMLYPDSGKYGVIAGTAPGGDSKERSFAIFGRQHQGLNYWDGE
ncbi:cupin domain-containing protein [Gallaecimonas xiamenensis]|uniref:Cupin n=1 Tax=Gallaecimonas xiamenensis 3-C-1 TaxID=745411 RepID=K2J0W9_9GAMM|nr:cupin domain-containing protein [Gallaecimonas xiamenensis]EKE68678.1 cupin [Gallaecimonas xiamenensis 3-C-1]